jgi:hypothetical protein
VPSGARRYQFMVRNRQKHKNTDGWGYALFNQDGVTYPEDPKVQEQACAACHRLVPTRGYVFSERLDLTGISASARNQPALPLALPFGSRKRSTLPSLIRQHIPNRYPTIYFLKGDLQKHLFQGTLDEVRPLLSQTAAEKNAPAAIISEDQTRFSIVFPDTDSTICSGEKEKAMRAFSSSTTAAADVNGITFCYAK